MEEEEVVGVEVGVVMGSSQSTSGGCMQASDGNLVSINPWSTASRKDQYLDACSFSSGE